MVTCLTYGDGVGGRGEVKLKEQCHGGFDLFSFFVKTTALIALLFFTK